MPRPRSPLPLLLVSVACSAQDPADGPSSDAASSTSTVAASRASGSSAHPSVSAPTLAERLREKREDILKIPTTTDGTCSTVGLRPLSGSNAMVCNQIGAKPFEVACKGPNGVHGDPEHGVAACDIRGNAAGEPCVHMFAIPACDGKQLVRCEPVDKDWWLRSLPRGKVVVETCQGPKGCYTDADAGLAAATCDHGS